MRVLILGEDAPGGLMASYARGFSELGGDVQTYCLATAYAKTLPSIRSRALRRVAEPVLLTAFNDRVATELDSSRADLVFVIKGHRLSAATIARLRRAARAPVVNFFPDDPFSRERSNRLAFGAGVLAEYDACFTFARHLLPRYREVGATAAHYLPFARDPGLHAPIGAARPNEFDVVFVGNLDADRVRFLEVLARDVRVGVFGERTTTVVPRGSALSRATFGPAAYGVDLAYTLAGGAISLNVMRPQNALSHNMRSYESPACGAFTLSQRTPELAELFDEGSEVVCFADEQELREAVGRWLPDAAGRMDVAAAGFERVREDTYARRAATVLECVGLEAGIAR